MRRLAVASVVVASLLAPAAAGAHNLPQGAARSIAAWIGERGVEAPGTSFVRSRVGTCTPVVTGGHTHRFNCDVVLVGPRGDGDEFFLDPGSAFGCLYKVTVSYESGTSTTPAFGNRLFDCTSGSLQRFFDGPPPQSIALPPVAASPSSPPTADTIDVHAPFGRPAGPAFTAWAVLSRVPITPYPVTLRNDEACPSSAANYCAFPDGDVHFEEVETPDEARGPRSYEFLHELGHLYEFDVFTWAGEDLRRRFVRAAGALSTSGRPTIRVEIKEKFAEAYASCAFDPRRLAPYRAYRSYGWRPPASVHRTLCSIIAESWKRFSGYTARPSASRPLALGLD
jgi:hypothetical protein